MKKWKIGVASSLLVALLVTLGIAIATDNAAQHGTRDDPSVSYSYLMALESQWMLEFTAELESVHNELMRQLNAEHAAIVQALNNRILDWILDEGVDINNPIFIEAVTAGVVEQIGNELGVGDSGSALFRRVDVSAGYIFRGEIGTEVVLRLGSAYGVNTVSADNPAMVNLTTGQDLNDGAELNTNHLYLITIADNGFRAGDERTATVFVRGPGEVVAE